MSVHTGDAYRIWLRGAELDETPVVGTTPGASVTYTVLLDGVSHFAGAASYDPDRDEWGDNIALPGPGLVHVRWVAAVGAASAFYSSSVRVRDRT